MPTSPRVLTHTVSIAESGKNVAWVCRHALHLTDHEVSRAKFREDGIRIDGRRAFSGEILKTGQLLQVAVGDGALKLAYSAVVAKKGSLDIVYEDADLLVVDKPAGMVTHPGPGHYDDTLANRVLAHLEERGVQSTFHAVYRLDRETSGLLVVATNAHAQDILQRRLHTPEFTRTYIGIAGDMPGAASLKDEGRIDAPLRADDNNLDAYCVCKDGKSARTDYEVLNREENRTLLRFHLETGRTHQIRVHMAYLGHPLLGDMRYGGDTSLIGRAALHSSQVSFVHPVDEHRLTFDSGMPADMQRLL